MTAQPHDHNPAGFYNQSLTRAELADLDRALGDSLRGEIGMLRVVMRRFFACAAQEDDDVKTLAEALRALGLTGPVIMASRRSALDLAEDAARSYREIILLTDWDRKGDEMARTIEQHLWSVGSRPDGEIRSRIKKLVRKEIKDVESLHRYMERMRYLYGP